jgi:hypothetical protein
MKTRTLYLILIFLTLMMAWAAKTLVIGHI